MGSFSWLKADDLTRIKNIAYDKPFKMLIPKEFGGGFIKDNYQDYGYIGKKEDGSPKHDMYELLAICNLKGTKVKPITYNYKKGLYEEVEIDFDSLSPLKEIDDKTNIIRSVGIDIGCYDNQIKKLKYPLKLVSVSYKGTYEECKGISLGDPEQGCLTYR